MDYFIMEQDIRFCSTIYLPVIDYLSYQDIRQLNIDKLQQMTVVLRNGERYEEYPDFLSKQLFLAGDSLKDVMDLFLPNKQYKTFCIWDQYKELDFYYYAYSVPILDCLTADSINQQGKRRSDKITLKKNSTRDLDIIKADGLESHLFLVTLAVAEVILRRGLKGISFTAVTTE